MPDHFDRLVARGTGLASGAAAGRDNEPASAPLSVPARPRLPLPFERPGLAVTEDLVETGAPRSAAVPAPGPAGAPAPAASGTGSAAPALARLIRHETILREHSRERSSSGQAWQSAPPEEWRPVTAPDTPAAPAPREPAGPQEPRRPEAARPARDPGAPRARRPAPAPAASPARPVDARPERAVALPAARRETRATERVVRVSIGRLEVTAAAAPRPPARDRPPPRREPTVTLDRFLARRAGEDGRA